MCIHIKIYSADTINLYYINTHTQATAGSSGSCDDDHSAGGHCSSSHASSKPSLNPASGKVGGVSGGSASLRAGQSQLLLLAPPSSSSSAVVGSTSRISAATSDWDESMQSEVVCGTSDTSSDDEVSTGSVCQVAMSASVSIDKVYWNVAILCLTEI